MKKIILSFLIITGFSAIAQISVTKKSDGSPIIDGQIITYTVATDPQSSLGFNVHNNTAAPVLTRILFVSATNYNGTNFQLCYGTECIDNITVGQSYPNPSFEIPANGQNGNYDHFLNTNTGNGTSYPMDFVFKIYTVNTSGVEYGTPVTFTYRYDPTMATTTFSELNDMGVTISNTLIENSLELTTTKSITVDLFDVNGKKVYSDNLNMGIQNLDLSSLSSSIYFLNITTEDNLKKSIKIIKK